MKRAMKGELPLLAAIKQLMDEVISPSLPPRSREGPLAGERKMLAQAKEARPVCGRRRPRRSTCRTSPTSRR